MLGTRRLPRTLLALVAAAPLAAPFLVASPAATAAPSPSTSWSTASSLTGPWTVRWTSRPLAAAPTTEGGVWGSWGPSISGDGTLVAFTSSSRLSTTGKPYPGSGPRAFLRRVGDPAPVRLALTPGGQVGNGVDASGCGNCDGGSDLSSDGRTAVFESASDNLTPGDTNHTSDIFRRDLTTGAVTLVSHGPGGAPANGVSSTPQVSADGRWVTFYSVASNLTPGSTGFGYQSYLYDAQSDTLRLLGMLDNAYPVVLSGDGTTVVTTTSRALVSSDVDTKPDTYVIDLATGAATLAGVGNDGVSLHGSRPTISDDGTKVAFTYQRGRTAPQIVVRDLTTGQTATIPGSRGVPLAEISGDGSRLALLRADPVDGSRRTEVTDLTGRTLYTSGADSNSFMSASINHDGSCVAYSTGYPEVAEDVNGSADVYTACQG